MLRVLLVAVLFASASERAQAHDFWLAASRYHVQAGETVDLDFVVGHGADNELWDLRWHRVVALRSFLDGRVTDRQRGLRPLQGRAQAGDRPGASVTFAEPGTHIIAFESNHALSELDPFAFENHLAEEGLEHAIALREARGQRAAPGTEIYARRAKVLIQTDDVVTDVSQPLGHTLEIVPLDNPFDTGRSASMRFQVLYRGEPLQGGLVRLRSLDVGSASALRSVRSDANGEVMMPIPQTGSWLVTVVWTSGLETHSAAQFETMFASLTFGY
jgi:uncharacterized GH25 family protein